MMFLHQGIKFYFHNICPIRLFLMTGINTNTSLDSAHIVKAHHNQIVVRGPSPVQEFDAQEGRKENMWVVIDNVPSLRSGLIANNGTIYEIEDEILAKAIHGEVRRGYLLENAQELDNFYARKQLVVIKIINIPEISHLKKEDPLAEMSFLQLIGPDTCNISRQIDCILHENKIFSVMPYCGEELLQFAGNLSTEKIKHCFRQIVHGVRNLQMLNICHRDLSLENILIHEDTGECSIIDFGMALLVPHARKSNIATLLHSLQSEDSDNNIVSEDVSTDGEEESFEDDFEPLLMLPQGSCGKENFIAPEILENNKPFNGLVVDNWALGVILFTLFTGRTPFLRASSSDRWFRQIQREPLQVVLQRWKILHHIPHMAVDLLDKMLKLGVCPETRYSTSDILAHPWMVEE
jgi:serine/threonine protein kinase